MIRKIIEKIKGIGGGALGIIVFLLLLLLSVVFALIFITGTAWIGSMIMPGLITATTIFTLISLLILIPLLFFKETRIWSGTALFFVSWIFGVTLWFFSFFATYILWDFLGLFIGLFFLGIGLIPVAFIASLLSGEWMMLAEIIYMIILTFGTRFLGLYIVEKEENRTQQEKFIEITTKKSLTEKFNALPEWIRWILFLPVSLFFSFLLGPVFYIISYMGGFIAFIMNILHPVAIQILFLLMIFHTVPRGKLTWIKALIGIQLIFLIILIIGPLMLYYMGEIIDYNMEFFGDLIGELMTLIVSLLLFIRLKKTVNNNYLVEGIQ
jgi:hypothetical protein